MTDEQRKAYYRGKNRGHDFAQAPVKYHAVLKEHGYTDPALIAEFKNGWRHAMAEERLNVDTEWDD